MRRALLTQLSGAAPFKVGPDISSPAGYTSGVGCFFLTSGNMAARSGVITSLQLDLLNGGNSFALFAHNGAGVVSSITASNIAAVAGLQTYSIPSLPIAVGENIGVWFTGNTNGFGYGFNGGTAYYIATSISKPAAGTNLLGGGFNFNGNNIRIQATAS